MRRTTQLMLVVLVLLQSLFLAGCGGGGTLPSGSSSGGAVSLTSLSLSPNTPPTLAVGGTRQFSATGIYSDGSTAALGSGVTWSSSATGVATVSSSGLVSAVALGSATITATDGSHQASVNVTVAAQAATLTSIALSPNVSTALAVGSTRQLVATGSYSDGGTATLNTGLTWTSSATAIATISSTGLVTAVAPGSTSISATEAGVTSTPITVNVQATPVTLTSITVTPATVPSLSVLGTQQLSATGHYSDNSTAALSSGVTWASSNTAVATVSGSGVVTGVTAGTANITATVGGVTSAPPAAVTVVATPMPAAAGQVFYGGNYASNVSFVAFGGSVNNVLVDNATTCPGHSYGSLRIDFAPSGSYTGGALVDGTGPRNLAAYDALVFYAKSSAALTTDKFGLGNSAGATSGFEAERPAIALTTSWQQVVVPIPDGSKLASPGIAGLFHFADGTNHAGSMWVCDVQYASLGSAVLGTPTPSWNNGGITVAAGGTYQVVQTDLSANWAGGSGGALFDNIINYGYMSFTPSNANATVSASGLITGNNSGSSAVTSAITATLQGHASSNTLPVTVNAPIAVPPPSAAPAVPGTLAGSVAAVFDSSNAKTPIAGVSFPNFGGSNETDVTVGGNTLKQYIGLSYSGIQLGALTDVSTATHLHFDVYTTGAQQFGLKIVTFTNVGGNPGAESCAGQILLSPTSTPALTAGSWISVDVPLSSLTPTDGCASAPTSAQYQGLFQLLPLGNTPNGALSGSATFWLDNLYFY